MRWVIWGSVPGKGKRFFYFSKTTSLALGLTSLLFWGYWDFLSDSICQLGHADHHLPPSNDGGNKHSCTSTVPDAFMVWTGPTLPLPFKKSMRVYWEMHKLCVCVWGCGYICVCVWGVWVYVCVCQTCQEFEFPLKGLWAESRVGQMVGLLP
jgi:hypothetical protein